MPLVTVLRALVECTPMELVVLVGLQASGKSTFFQTFFAGTHAHISKDRFRNNKNPARRQTQLIQAALQMGHSVVVDNTNPTLEDRSSLIYLGRLYSAEIIGYYFKSQVPDCLQRNQQRLGKAQVPDVAIYATAKKLTTPALAEGFHQLFSVCVANNFTFAVQPWTDEVTCSVEPQRRLHKPPERYTS